MAKVKESIFTIILTNYNNFRFINEALDSIIEQDYQNIELIVTDDSSDYFDSKYIEKYVKKNQKGNIKKLDIIINNENIGTVKTLNKAIKKASGDYILFFASDDKLGSPTIVSKYVSVFKKRHENILTSQWINCDSDLKPISKFVNSIESLKFNHRNIKKQLFRLCQSNIYGSGSTCYRSSLFKKFNYLDEKYKLLEDWPFWIRLLFNNEKIYYCNFDGLFHRTGGISENVNGTSNTIKKFYQEILETFYFEIIPNINQFSTLKQLKIINSYNHSIEVYSKFINVEKYRKLIKKILKKNKKLKLYWYIDKFNPHILRKIKLLFKYNVIVPVTVIIWIALCILLGNLLITNKNIYFLSIIILYFIIYSFVNFIYNLIKH